MEHTKWQPATIPANDRSHEPGLDFVLTPQERDKAILGQLFLIARRNRLNELDRQQADAQTARELAEALRSAVL